MSYHFIHTDGQHDFDDLREANAAANEISAVDQVELKVVHTESGILATVHTPVSGRYFHPWERVETPKHPAPDFEGYMPAYTRKRIGATAYRATEKGKGWRVYDGRTGHYQDTADTKETAHLFTAMRLGKML